MSTTYTEFDANGSSDIRFVGRSTKHQTIIQKKFKYFFFLPFNLSSYIINKFKYSSINTINTLYTIIIQAYIDKNSIFKFSK